MTVYTVKVGFLGSSVEKKKYFNVFDFIIEDGELTLFVSSRTRKGMLDRLNLGDISNYDKVYSEYLRTFREVHLAQTDSVKDC